MPTDGHAPGAGGAPRWRGVDGNGRAKSRARRVVSPVAVAALFVALAAIALSAVPFLASKPRALHWVELRVEDERGAGLSRAGLRVELHRGLERIAEGRSREDGWAPLGPPADAPGPAARGERPRVPFEFVRVLPRPQEPFLRETVALPAMRGRGPVWASIPLRPAVFVRALVRDAAGVPLGPPPVHFLVRTAEEGELLDQGILGEGGELACKGAIGSLEVLLTWGSRGERRAWLDVATGAVAPGRSLDLGLVLLPARRALSVRTERSGRPLALVLVAAVDGDTGALEDAALADLEGELTLHVRAGRALELVARPFPALTRDWLLGFTDDLTMLHLEHALSLPQVGTPSALRLVLPELEHSVLPAAALEADRAGAPRLARLTQRFAPLPAGDAFAAGELAALAADLLESDAGSEVLSEGAPSAGERSEPLREALPRDRMPLELEPWIEAPWVGVATAPALTEALALSVTAPRGAFRSPHLQDPLVWSLTAAARAAQGAGETELAEAEVILQALHTRIAEWIEYPPLASELRRALARALAEVRALARTAGTPMPGSPVGRRGRGD